jgi:release factor glutamine methyltransferase
MTVRASLSLAADYLDRHGVPTPSVDAEWLLAGVLGVSRSTLQLERGRELTAEEQARLDALVERRAGREPLAYVLGEWGFRNLTVKVDARALIPRPETEIVVERCLALLDGTARPQVLDVGAGSGAIALAIADEHPGAEVTAFEVSPGALALARENFDRAGVNGRVRLLAGDLVEGFGDNRYDLVVSNPPYVTPDEIATLEPEIREWEPRLALVGVGKTEAVARNARGALRAGGHLVLEISAGRGRESIELLRDLGYHDSRLTRDLAGRDRVVEGRWA